MTTSQFFLLWFLFFLHTSQTVVKTPEVDWKTKKMGGQPSNFQVMGQ